NAGERAMTWAMRPRFLLALTMGTALACGCSDDPAARADAAAASGAGTGGASSASSGVTGTGAGGTAGSAGAGGSSPCSPTPTSGNVVWAKQAGGAGWDTANGVAASPDGSVTITGNFDAAAAFGPEDPGKIILYPAATDMYAAR